MPQASFSVVRTPQCTLPAYASGASLPASLLDGLFEHCIWPGGSIVATLTDFFPVCYPDRSIFRPLTVIFLTFARWGNRSRDSRGPRSDF